MQGGGGGYEEGWFKIWWKGMGCEPSPNNKSGGHPKKRNTKKKKNDQKRKKIRY